MKTTIIMLLAFLSFSVASAQQTGIVNYPQLGIQFEIPEGWVGQETEAGYLMGHQTIPGIILVMTNEAKNISELESGAHEGIADINGTQLSLKGELLKVGANGLGGNFEGTLEWQPAKAFIIGIINNFQGYSVSIISATASNAYTSENESVARQVAKTLIFSEAEIPDQTAEWGESLKNARLTYMDSNYSNDGSYGNTGYTTGGGYSTKTVIDLCAAGYFNHSHNSSMSFDTGGGFGSGNNQEAGAGKWKVTHNASGQSVLQLTFYNGEVSEYVLELNDSKTYLNGERYFRTYGEYRDDGPDCN